MTSSQRQDTNTAIRVVQRARVIGLGQQAAHIQRSLAPDQDQTPDSTGGTHLDTPQRDDQGQDRETPHLIFDPRAAASDLADYLDAARPTPERTRSDVPHATDWQLDHAMHLIRSVAHAVTQPGTPVPNKLRLPAMQELLDLAVESALLSRDPDNRTFLDRLVRGELPARTHIPGPEPGHYPSA